MTVWGRFPTCHASLRAFRSIEDFKKSEKNRPKNQKTA